MATKLYSGTTRIYPHDALLRSANDFSTFTEKVTPVTDDILLSEDSAASYIKKKMKPTSLTKVFGQAISSTNPNSPYVDTGWTSGGWLNIISYTASVLAGKYVVYACTEFWGQTTHRRGEIRLNSSAGGQLLRNQYRTFANPNSRYAASIWAQDGSVVTDRSMTWTFDIAASQGTPVRGVGSYMMVWRIS